MVGNTNERPNSLASRVDRDDNFHVRNPSGPQRPVSKWQTVKIRIKVSTAKEGELTASIDGDEFQGVKGVALYRPQATDYRPKWGLYRGVDKEMNLGDDYIEHKNASAQKR